MKSSVSISALEHKTQFRVELKHEVAIGPGKADVLQSIQHTGSLAETGRQLGMSYQKVWTLVSAMNRDFIAPLVTTQRGGSAGGGAQLTSMGVDALAVYREIEREAQAAVAKQLPRLLKMIRPDAGERSGT